MVYESGTSTIETTSRTGPQSFSGFGVGSGGSWSSTSGTLSGATTTTTGKSTTDLARQVAPPKKATSGWQGIGCLTLLVGVGGGILIAALHNDKVGQTISGLVFLGSLCVGLVVFIVLMRRAIRYNRRVLPGLTARWSRLWLCLACGKVFEPAASPPASPYQSDIQAEAQQSVLGPASSAGPTPSKTCSNCGAPFAVTPDGRCIHCRALLVS
jgi:hypothetical protein